MGLGNLEEGLKGGCHSPDQECRGNRKSISSCSWGALGWNMDGEEWGEEGKKVRTMGCLVRDVGRGKTQLELFTQVTLSRSSPLSATWQVSTPLQTQLFDPTRSWSLAELPVGSH